MPGLERLAKSYLMVYGFVHIAAIMLGIGVASQPDWVSVGGLLSSAFLCFIGVAITNKWFRWFMSFGWSVAAMVEWMKLIPWMPPYSDLQYNVFALLNLGAALSLAYLAGQN